MSYLDGLTNVRLSLSEPEPNDFPKILNSSFLVFFAGLALRFFDDSVLVN